MSLPVSGKTYTFECLGAEGMFLNLYYSNGVSDGQNVILWEGDGSLEQQWKYNGSKLLTVRNTNFALDKYTVSGSANNNNADVWTANDPTNQNIVFVATSSGDNVVKIKLASSNMYLTAYGFENGTSGGKTPTSTGNVYWTSSDKGSMQQWICREIGTTNGQYLALPINHCTITAMYQEDSNPAYQHEWDAGGHFGLDMTGWSNPFYASGDGTVVGVGGTATTGVGYWVAICYDNVYAWNTNNNSLRVIPSIIMRYFHLASMSSLKVGDHVNLNTLIGTYGHTGQWSSSMGSHLHVEVDTDIEKPLYTPTLTGAAGGLYAGVRGTGDTTFDPCTVFFIKESAPEEQTLSYSQSRCDKHSDKDEYYINVDKMQIFMTKVLPE